MENRYGIEIELENVRRTDRFGFPPLWVIEGDGSLRNSGVEFKSSSDHSFADAVFSLDTLHDYLQINRIEAEPTARCGVHIHMDVRDMSHVQVYNLLCNYSMIEPAFFAWVNGLGTNRETSHFCVPYYHTASRAATLLEAFRDYNPTQIRVAGRKYMALNVLPYLTFGSVEWRHFPAVIPVTSIKGWLDVLDAFKERSKQGLFTEEQLTQWVEEHFPDVYTEDIIDRGLETYYLHSLPHNATPETPRTRAGTARTLDDIFRANHGTGTTFFTTRINDAVTTTSEAPTIRARGDRALTLRDIGRLFSAGLRHLALEAAEQAALGDGSFWTELSHHPHYEVLSHSNKALLREWATQVAADSMDLEDEADEDQTEGE